MILTHKIKLHPNNQAKTYIKKAIGCSRLAYNWGLARWKEYHKEGVNKSTLDLKKEFNSIKKTQFPFVYEVTKYAVQQPFIQLGLAFKAYFNPELKNEFPQFKKKKINEGSFYIGNDVITFEFSPKRGYVKLPLLSSKIKMMECLKFEKDKLKGKIQDYKISFCTISQEGKDFYISVTCEITPNKEKNKNITYKKETIGIDLGIKTLATLSDGKTYHLPNKIAKENKKLKREHKKLSRKQVKSANFKKQVLKLRKIYKKIKNIKQDFLHKTTTEIAHNYKVIKMEDLNTSGMLKNHKLARSLANASFYQFKQLLTYKVSNLQHKDKDKKLIVIDRFYPSSKLCSCCGHKKEKLALYERIYVCEQCGFKEDRDVNAAINIENYSIYCSQ